MNEQILFVDDDPNILAGYKRVLRNQFQIATAQGGEEGLATLESQGPFAVVMADMRMPGMDGIQFLARVKERAPTTVRMMLTGNADLQTAIDAVNEGNIFRFLTKPCPPETLAKALRAGIDQYRLITAERELLTKTLNGVIKVLTEILSLVDPQAFSRSMRIRRYVRHIANALELPNLWQYELAAMLSQIGCVTLPPDVMDKVYAQELLTDEELKMFWNHPGVAAQLLANIPRLETVARMIAGQQRPFQPRGPAAPEETADEVSALGAQILKAAIDFDVLLFRGYSARGALLKMMEREGEYNPRVLAALQTLQVKEMSKAVRAMRVDDLHVGMIAGEDIRALNGVLLLPKDQPVTYPVLERLRNFARMGAVKEPFLVLTVVSTLEEEGE